jgi:hypothetical protein
VTETTSIEKTSGGVSAVPYRLEDLLGHASLQRADPLRLPWRSDITSWLRIKCQRLQRDTVPVLHGLSDNRLTAPGSMC